MPGYRSSTSERVCPRCLAQVGIGRTCAVCGLAQGGARAERLRELVARLSDLGEQRAQLDSQSAALVRERDALLAALDADERPVGGRLSSSSEPAWSVPGPGGPEWGPERVRDVLLWLGVVLLAVAALIFTIVTWSRLGESGRALMVFGMTIVTGGLAVLLRRRLPATGEALCSLGFVLLLVCWYAMRRAGALGGLDGLLWWALGAAVVSCYAFATARLWGFRCARISCAVLGIAAAALVVGGTTDALWTAAIGVALVVAGSVSIASVLRRHVTWREAEVSLYVGAVVCETVAFGLALAAAVRIDSGSEVLGPAVAVLMLGLAPSIAAVVAPERRRAGSVWDLFVVLAVASVLGALVTCCVGSVSPVALATIGAGLGALACIAALLVPRAVSRGTRGAGVVALGIGVAVALPRVMLCLVGPLGWFFDPWSLQLSATSNAHLGSVDQAPLTFGWSTVCTLTAVAIAAAAGAWMRSRTSARVRRLTEITAMVAFSCAVAVAAVALDASIGTALMIELVVLAVLMAVSATVELRRPGLSSAFLAAAGTLAVPIAGWAATDATASVVALAVAIVLTASIGSLRSSEGVRVGLLTLAGVGAVAETAVVCAMAEVGVAPMGFAVTATGAALLLLGALGRPFAREGPPLEIVGVVAIGFGLGLSAGDATWLATTLSLVVPAFGLAGLRESRDALYGGLAAAAAVGAVWTWLFVAEVRLLEAYTVPLAAVALGVGALRRRDRAAVGSGIAYGPGLAIGLIPSLVAEVTGDGAARPFALTFVAVASVLVGAHWRLRAPLIAGALTMLILALDAIAPIAADVPRWATIGTLGIVMLWMGATTERRVAQVQRWRHDLEQLA